MSSEVEKERKRRKEIVFPLLSPRITHYLFGFDYG